jgi:crossover junction endodeoxyribonuclease RusA
MEITEVILELPLPAKCLSPNARSHWATKAKAVRSAKAMAFFLMKKAIADNKLNVPWPAATVLPRLYYRLNRTRDRDNIIASAKSHLDGVAKAGLLLNDCFLKPMPAEIIIDKSCTEKMELLFRKLEKHE